nr:hypothetical protein [Tanacetum cinerariifolium]
MSVLLEETRVRCPSIAPWVEFCYAQPARIYYDDSILWSCQGVQQGDPLGPLLFALALHPLVQTINQSCELTFQAWYLDDGTIVGDTLMVAKALDIIKTNAPTRGLFLNVDKTKLFGMWRILEVQFDHALRATLEKVVTASGSGYGDWQCALQAKILMKIGIESRGSSFQHALDAFNTTCNVDVLSVTTCTYSPQMMKTLAKYYFGVIKKDLVSKYSLSPRHVAILSCVRAPHMDQWGDHAVHCSSEVGVKFRHNLVRDILVDKCSKVRIMVRKEALMGFLSDDEKDQRPADLLLFNWLQGKDACLDVTFISLCWEFDTKALDTVSRIKSISISHSNSAKSGAFIFHKGLRTVKSILPKCLLGFSRALKRALDKVICKPDDISCWVSLLVLPLYLLKTFDPRSNLECKSANKRQRQEESSTNAIRSWGVPGGSLQLELKAKHPFKSATSLPNTPIDHHHLIASQDVVLDRIKSFPRVNLFLGGKCPMMLDEYIASAPLTPLVKPSSGIHPIAVGTVWRRLISKVSAIMIGHSLDGYLDGLQFGVGVPRGGEAILHAVNRFVEDRGDDVGLSMLLVDFQNAFNLVDSTTMLEEVRLRCPAISRWVEFCYSSPARLYYGEHSLWSCQGVQHGDPLGPLLFSLVLHPLICQVLELIMEDGPHCDLHLNVDKTELFSPKEDPRSRLEGVFPPNISRPLYGVKLLGGPVTVDLDFSSALVMKRVSKTIGLLDAVAKINDPQSYGSTFEDVLCVFNSVMEIDFLSNPSEMALWLSQREDHTSYWLRVVSISELGQTMNSKTYRSVLCYRLGILAGKEVDIRLGGGYDKALRPADMMLYSWDVGLDVCVDLTGSSPLTQTGMTDFAPGRAVIDAAQRKRVKYEAKCADIGYDFLPFSFSSFEELEKDAVTLLKWVQKFSMAQDIGSRAAVHIFNRINFFIAKGELEKDAVTLLKWVQKFSMAQDIGARAAVHIFNRINFVIAKGVDAR